MRPVLTVSKSTFDFINKQATKAIQELTKKDSLDDCDIKAINEILVLCKIKPSDFSISQK